MADLEVAKKRVETILGSLPEKVELSAFTLKSKLPMKVISIRELSIHRVASFSSGAISLLESNKIVPAAVLTRSIFETTALIFYIKEKNNEFMVNKNIEQFDDFLMKGLIGSRNESTGYSSGNVLTYVDKIDKLLNGYRSGYDSLSELAHPNWAGLLGAYGEINKSQHLLTLGQGTLNHTDFTINCLCFTLSAFEKFYNQLGEDILSLNEYFESL